MDTFRAALTDWLARGDNSQAELSRQSGIPQGVISRWLSPKPTRPSPANLEKVAPVLEVPYDELLRMCGYRHGEPMERVDSRRLAVRDQLDRWLMAVGPEYEQDFWEYLKAHGDSGVDLIRRLGTAVSGVVHPAVSDAVSARPKRGRKPLGTSDGPLSPRQHPTRPAPGRHGIPAGAF